MWLPRFALPMLGLLAFSFPAGAAQDELAHQAVGVLNRYCTSCHGSEAQEGGLRLDSFEGFKAGGDSGEPLTAGALAESLLWRRVGIDSDMPPKDHPQPTAEEKQLLQRWIQAGGEFPVGSGENTLAALAGQASQIFRKHCYSCHGQQFKAPELDFGNYQSLVFPARDGKDPRVVAGSPDESILWKRIANETMPPRSQKARLTVDEKETIRAWIAAGAPRWTSVQAARRFVTRLDVHTAIRDDLRGLPVAARRHQRYFTFAHLHNNASVSDQELALFKAALSKLLNSLTWESEMAIPRPVDEQQTVYAVDLRDLDWTEANHWNALFSTRRRPNDQQHMGYSYGLEFDQPLPLADLAEEIKALSQSSMFKLCVRADWFVVKASRPPLYHELLELPATAAELEARLEVATQADWLLPDLMRGAVTRSSVSSSNRVLDRHRALHGAYWISYDFKTSTGKGELASRPLGPKFANHPFEKLAFEHDGGEIVFTLPNGLNGYFLIDGQKNRIGVGPIAIVSDPNQWSGTPEVVTGVSCIACHRNGVVRFADEIRATVRLSGAERRKVDDLFAPVEVMNRRLAKDEERFLTACLEAVRPFLPINTVEELRSLPDEPVGALAQFYYADVTLATAAAELGYETPEQLRDAVRRSPDVAFLAALAKGGVIKRERWENRASANSGFQEAALALGVGVPVN